MSEEQYQKMQQERHSGEQLTPEALSPLSEKYDRALAIDPGKDSMHLAWTNGERVAVWHTSFWALCQGPFERRPSGVEVPRHEMVVILEAPYLSAPEKSNDTPSAVAYGSGMVAREAQLLKARLRHLGYHIDEFDPARYQSSSWTADTAAHFVDEWDGPNNEHARDAVRLLFYYDFI